MLVSLRAWLIAAHAFPLTAVMALTALIALVSANGKPDGSRLVALLIAMLASQLAIGWSNDYLDREADAVHQPWKPIVRGEVDAEKMPVAIIGALIVSFAAGVTLGWMPLLLLIIGTGAGLAYNLWLKASRFSALPYLVALGVLPPFVWTALDVYEDDFLGLYLVATPLTLAAHLANVLPDVESDRAQGRQTLAVGLGAVRTLVVLSACLLAPLPLLVVARTVLDDAGNGGGFYEESVLIPVVVAYIALVAVAGALYAGSLWSASRPNLVRAFRCVVVAGVLFAVGWLAAVA
jgi:4-hydroxybenzoate polyprenyltransferase